MRIQRKEEISVALLRDIFVEWAKSYYIHNKKVPKVILLYREGLSDIQAQQQLRYAEIPALEEMMQVISTKTKTPNYRPEIMIVLANKKINSRYFTMVGEHPTNPNKFIPQLKNPESGSVLA